MSGRTVSPTYSRELQFLVAKSLAFFAATAAATTAVNDGRVVSDADAAKDVVIPDVFPLELQL